MAIYEKRQDGTYKKISQIYVGKSAYAIAVDNGFEGTVEEWLEVTRNAITRIVKIPATGWSNTSPFQITLSVAGVFATDTLFWDVELDVTDTLSQVNGKIAAYKLIDKIEAGNGFITLYCWSGLPVNAFDLKVVAIHATET